MNRRRVLLQALVLSPLVWLEPASSSVVVQSERCEDLWEASCEKEGLPVTSDAEWAACPPESLVGCPPSYATGLVVPPAGSIDLGKGLLVVRGSRDVHQPTDPLPLERDRARREALEGSP